MNELARHIEILLLESDCVVIPGFGGFITHYMPATRNDEDCIFSPPLRSIGFNPQLKMNDGVLVQSYMESYGTDFSDATKILEQQVNRLIDTLHKEGKVDLQNIGELSLSVHDTYVFTPYNDKLVSPSLYGLDAFEIKHLELLRQTDTEQLAVPATASKKTYDIRISRAFVRHAVAAVAAILLFFYLSTPIENTYVEKENYAQLLSTGFLSKIEPYSLITTSVGGTTAVVADNTIAEEIKSTPEEAIVSTASVLPDSKKEEAPVVSTPPSKQYHIIVASVVTEKDAQKILSRLVSDGFSNARILVNGSRIRVSIDSYQEKEEANKSLIELRKQNAYQNAWLLTR